MATYSYHVTRNPNEIVLSCNAKVAGWLAPSAGVGACVAGDAETLMDAASAKSFLEAKAAEGHTIAKGKDISSNGVFTLKGDIANNRRPIHK